MHHWTEQTAIRYAVAITGASMTTVYRNAGPDYDFILDGKFWEVKSCATIVSAKDHTTKTRSGRFYIDWRAHRQLIGKNLFFVFVLYKPKTRHIEDVFHIRSDFFVRRHNETAYTYKTLRTLYDSVGSQRLEL